MATTTARPAASRTATKEERMTWWLREAQKAAGRIPDAQRPHNVIVKDSAKSTYMHRPRLRKTNATLVVSKSDFRKHTNRDTGRWLAAFAASSGRWSLGVQKGSYGAPIFTLIGAMLAGLLAMSPPNPAAQTTWIVAFVVLLVGGVGGAIWRRRQRTQMMRLSDEQAVSIAGMDAAAAILGGEEATGLYKTAVHAWWRRTDAQSPQNRLARLKKRHGVVDDDSVVDAEDE